jgi:hypothetical protein
MYARVMGLNVQYSYSQRLWETYNVPRKNLKEGHPSFIDFEGGVSPFDEEEEGTDDDEYEDGPSPWYDSDSTDEGTEGGYEDEFDYYADEWDPVPSE